MAYEDVVGVAKMLHREGVVNQEFVDRVVNQDYPEVSYPSEEEEEEEESE